MNSYLNYLLEVNAALTTFIVLYALLLRNEKSFSSKRKVIIASLMLAVAAPALNALRHTLFPSAGFVPNIIILPEITNSPAALSTAPEHGNSYWAVLTVYFAVASIAAIRFVIQVGRLMIYAWRTPGEKTGPYRIIRIPGNATFSFFHHIFIGDTQELSNEDRALIIRHEMVHAAKFHSLDRLLIEMVQTICWFNPLLIYYKRELTALHEFESDEEIIQQTDVKKYCNLLARVALMSADFKIANHFNNSLTSKRITMMKTIKMKIKTWKMVVIVPLISCVVIIVACQEQTKHDSETQQTEKNTSTDKIYTIVEESATPVGGMPSLVSFISTNLKYPDEARKKGIEGKVFIEFIVNSDGSLSDFIVKKGVDASLDDEAIRVAKLLPAWSPGKQQGVPVRQQFVLPISFRLEPDANQKSEISEVRKEFNVSTNVSHSTNKVLVKGRVTDLGAPLEGVNVVVLGGTRGTSTDRNGNFSIEIPENTGQLAISFLGYQSKTIAF